MPANPAAPAPEQQKSPVRRRLILAVAMIGLAIAGLALVDQFRDRRAAPTAPHEPSQALITTPAPPPDDAVAKPELPVTPPPPPQIVNNETLAPPSPAVAAAPASPQEAANAPAAEATPLAPGKAYLVQVGVFTSPANAQALQKQLQRAGIAARLETRVQLGPFKDKRDADKALARAKKLGINAVLVSAR